MRTIFIAIALAFVGYGLDAYLYNGKYAAALVQMTSQIVHQFR